MTIRRAPRRDHWTKIDNRTIEDDRLSYKALGLLVYVLSKPDHWEVRREQLAGSHRGGEAAIRSALAELTECGYLRREARRDPKSGRVRGWVSTVHELAGQTERVVSHQTDNPPGGKSTRRENRQTDNQPLVSTEVVTRTETNTTTSPNGDSALRGFTEFWDRYPRRDGKKLYRQKAEQQWKGLSLEDRRAAWRGAGHYAAACEQGLTRAKDALRWLRDRCWEDWQTPATADVKREKRDGQVQSWSPASAPTGRQFGGSLA